MPGERLAVNSCSHFHHVARGNYCAARFNASDVFISCNSNVRLMLDSDFSSAQLRCCGVQAAAMRASGCSAQQLKSAGYSLRQLQIGGYSAAELKVAG